MGVPGARKGYSVSFGTSTFIVRLRIMTTISTLEDTITAMIVAILWMWTAIVCVPSVGLLVFQWWSVAFVAVIAAAVGVAVTTREFPKEDTVHEELSA